MKLTQKISGWMLIACAALLIAGGDAQAAGIPQLINYQGKLTNASGDPVPDSQYAVTFSIYEIPTGGTALWSESWPLLQTYGGDFSAMLGSVTAIPATFFSEHPTTYLGIKVGFDTEMTPRQQIGAVAYAFHAGNVEGSGVPSGGIILWSGPADQIPSGWALCDGANGTPDLRNRFVVGAGGGYEIGATGGEAMHALTINEMPSHTHTQNAHSHALTDPGHIHGIPSDQDTDTADEIVAVGNDADVTVNTNSATTGITINSATATNQNAGGGQAHENRPPYFALAFIMKL